MDVQPLPGHRQLNLLDKHDRVYTFGSVEDWRNRTAAANALRWSLIWLVLATVTAAILGFMMKLSAIIFIVVLLVMLIVAIKNWFQVREHSSKLTRIEIDARLCRVRVISPNGLVANEPFETTRLFVHEEGVDDDAGDDVSRLTKSCYVALEIAMTEPGAKKSVLEMVAFAGHTHRPEAEVMLREIYRLGRWKAAPRF